MTNFPGTASLKTSNSDITYKEKLLEGEAELTEKTMAVKSQHQSTSSSSSPKEQLQKDHQKVKAFSRGGKNSPRGGSGSILPSHSTFANKQQQQSSKVVV